MPLLFGEAINEGEMFYLSRFKANIWNGAIIYAQITNCMAHDLKVLYKLLGLIFSREWTKYSPKAAPKGDVSISIGLS